jgi:hypothetical protein
MGSLLAGGLSVACASGGPGIQGPETQALYAQYSGT